MGDAVATSDPSPLALPWLVDFCVHKRKERKCREEGISKRNKRWDASFVTQDFYIQTGQRGKRDREQKDK